MAQLDDAALERIQAVPFWQEVLHTGARRLSPTRRPSPTPGARGSARLQGVEEERHARLLGVMIRRPGLAAEEDEIEPTGPDLTAFADFDMAECLDSFLRFQGIQIARQARFLPIRCSGSSIC